MKKVLCLDLGTKTGFAMNNGKSGTVNFATKRHEGAGMRFLRFELWLDRNGFAKIDVIYFEEVRRHVGTTAAHIYGGLVAILIAWCEKHHVPYASVPVGTIKKTATGKGNASKVDVINAMRDKGFDPVDDNEADALAILFHIKKQGWDQ